MPRVIVRNHNFPLMGPLKVFYCASFLCRLRGLTFRRRLASDSGLLLVQGRDSRMEAAIHMLCVFIDLAVVWINEAGEVVDACLARRWRPFYAPRRPARYVLEIDPHRLADFHVGDRVTFEPEARA